MGQLKNYRIESTTHSLLKQCVLLSEVMLIHLQNISLKASCCTTLLGLIAVTPPLSFAQTRGDIVRIGDSVKDQNYYQSYWQNLRTKDVPTPKKSPSNSASALQPTTVLLSAQTLKNLRVRDLRLTYSGISNYRFRQNVTTQYFPNIYAGQPRGFPPEIYHPSRHINYLRPYLPDNSIKLIAGTLTNLNTFPVNVVGVNFKIVDAFGDLIQTGTVSPEPSMIGSRQSVTFQKPLYSLSLRKGYEVKLLDPAFILGD